MKYWSWTGIAVLLAVGLMALSMAPAVAESRIASVSATNSEGIAINDNGTVWMWGGAGSDGLVRGPSVVPGLANVTAVSCGDFIAVLKDDGTVWVLNTYPEISLVKVDGLDNITAISSGRISISSMDNGLFALKNDGTVWTWKKGNKPVRVEGLSDIIAISSSDHSLALKKDGTVWAWGMNGDGQLGDGAYSHTTGMDIMATGRDTPAPVANLSNVTAISTGDGFSMALKGDGTVWTWGDNFHGELGNGMPSAALPASAMPVQVMGLDHIVAISGGQYWALALRDDGTVWAWGSNRYYGTLGDGTTESKDAPVQVKGLSGIVDIHAGPNMFSFALDKYGVVWGWGHDDGGALGQKYGYRQSSNGYDTDYLRYEPTPVKVPFSTALAGAAVEPAWMVSQRPPIQIESEADAAGNISYMAAAGDDTLYAFKGNSLISIDNNGNARWNFTLPEGWCFGTAPKISDGWSGGFMVPDGLDGQVPVFMADHDHVYLYALSPNEGLPDPGYAIRLYPSNDTVVNKQVIAISRDGRLEWRYSFSEDVGLGDRAYIEARGDRIYLYHCYNETILDRAGNVLFSIDNVSDPASVDENGFIYSIPAVRQQWPILSHGTDSNGTDSYLDFRTPSSAVEAHYPNGTLCWRKDLNGSVARLGWVSSRLAGYSNLPLYRNGTLYVPLKGGADTGILPVGVAAFDTGGNAKWSKMYGSGYEAFQLMPIDNSGNVYFSKFLPDVPRLGEESYEIHVLGPEGSEVAPPKNYQFNNADDRAYDGILYTVTGAKSLQEKVDNAVLDPVTVSAFDLRSGTDLWNYTVPVSNAHNVTVNRSNVNAIFGGGQAGTGDVPGMYSQAFASVIPAGNVVYINYRAASYRYPVVYGVTNCTYVSALIALDGNGGAIWNKPMDSFVTATAVYVPPPGDKANNSTIFYSTDKGQVGSIPIVEAAAGLTILASLALFVKFFLLGSVARARTRLDNNDNRKSIMALIRERPGSSPSEIAKGTGINLGTVRYHLMILGLNHRIAAYNDGKFVRYFVNSNTYSREDQMAISLARREPLAEILKALLEKDEATNVELSDALGMPDSAVSKYLGELIKKGVVVKNPSSGSRGSYSVNSVHVARVANALRTTGTGTAGVVKGGTQQQAESCA